ncbi:hypothetical protein CEXT_510191 [Caerostris extrusa]|uniref:Uncharacterized protein n=1 Tax=Caerostris extrusa TaxID=172846 RepID=A0AAV4QWS6_CAEEX|nr:hypothetical protein CEXT_510191 [Caerostris extrusa]
MVSLHPEEDGRNETDLSCPYRFPLFPETGRRNGATQGVELPPYPPTPSLFIKYWVTPSEKHDFSHLLNSFHNIGQTHLKHSSSLRNVVESITNSKYKPEFMCLRAPQGGIDRKGIVEEPRNSALNKTSSRGKVFCVTEEKKGSDLKRVLQSPWLE